MPNGKVWSNAAPPRQNSGAVPDSSKSEGFGKGIGETEPGQEHD